MDKNTMSTDVAEPKDGVHVKSPVWSPPQNFEEGFQNWSRLEPESPEKRPRFLEMLATPV